MHKKRVHDKLKFDYHGDSVPNSDTSARKPRIEVVRRPKIEVVFRKNASPATQTNPEFKGYGLLDSGADITYIPKKIADLIKLNLDRSTLKETTSASGSFKTFRNCVYIELVFKKTRIPIGYVDIAISDSQIGNDEDKILLGRNGIFKEYEITFYESDKKIGMKKIYNKS